MSWERVYITFNAIPFEQSPTDREEVVWLYHAYEPDRGVTLGRMLHWEKEHPLPGYTPDQREYYFDGEGTLTRPTHWRPLVTGEPKPEPPDTSYLRCPDGTPHDWKSTPKRDGEPIVKCTKCGAYPD